MKSGIWRETGRDGRGRRGGGGGGGGYWQCARAEETHCLSFFTRPPPPQPALSLPLSPSGRPREGRRPQGRLLPRLRGGPLPGRLPQCGRRPPGWRPVPREQAVPGGGRARHDSPLLCLPGGGGGGRGGRGRRRRRAPGRPLPHHIARPGRRVRGGRAQLYRPGPPCPSARLLHSRQPRRPGGARLPLRRRRPVLGGAGQLLWQAHPGGQLGGDPGHVAHSSAEGKQEWRERVERERV